MQSFESQLRKLQRKGKKLFAPTQTLLIGEKVEMNPKSLKFGMKTLGLCSSLARMGSQTWTGQGCGHGYGYRTQNSKKIGTQTRQGHDRDK